MKKSKISMTMITFVFAVLLTLLLGDFVQAESKSPAKLGAKDFVYTWGGKKINFLKQSKKDETYHAYYWEEQGAEDVSDTSDIKTYRNVKMGSTESYVKKQYGKTKKVKVSKKEKYYKCMKYAAPNVDTSTWKNYLEYIYKKSGSSYNIRFYLNKKNKVAAIIYLKNLEKFYSNST